MPDPLHDGAIPSLAAEIDAYHALERASFHMPGHKQRGGLHPLAGSFFGEKLLRADVSEMGGFDYLHAPTGAMARAQARAAEVFGAAQTFFLVNGSTGGNLAAITAFAGDGDGLLMLRGSHRSVYTAAALAGAVPHYLPMAYDSALDGWFVAEPPATASLPAQLAVIHVTRPNYYGTACDLAPFVEIARHTGAVLIVDEAHGAHFGQHPSLPASALAQGADIVIQSTHKTLGGLTQASMLHVSHGSRADPARLAASLAMLQSSSPSALLTLSLDLAAEHLRARGRVDIARTVALALHVRQSLGRVAGLRVVDGAGWDPTKLVIDVAALGRSGFAAARWLLEHERLNVELADFRRIVCSITIGDSEETCTLLIDALTRFAGEGSAGDEPKHRRPGLPPPPPRTLTPRAARHAATESVSVGDVLGRTCAEYVIPYPPGIPIVVPGEVLTADVLGALASFRAAGSRIVGPNDASGATLLVTVPR